MARFSSWRRPALLNDSTGQDGRLSRTLRHPHGLGGGPARLRRVTAPSAPPGTSRGSPNARSGTACPRRASDAETTKCTHVDFRDPDLPWRYTPEPGRGDRLRPWLALSSAPRTR